MAGADVRLHGAPRLGGPVAGQPPWNLFVQVTLHLNDAVGAPVAVASAPAPLAPETPPATSSAAPSATACPACTAQSDCQTGQSCVAGFCVPSAAVGRTFVLAGTVRGADGAPLPEALLTVSDLPRVRIGVAPDGSFASPALPVGTTPVTARVVAGGFKAEQADLPRGDAGATVQHDFTLARFTKETVGDALLAVTVHDARSGKPLPKATVSVPVLSKRFTLDAAGFAEEKVRPGTYQVVVSSPGYRTQRKQVRLESNSRTIFNIALWAQQKR